MLGIDFGGEEVICSVVSLPLKEHCRVLQEEIRHLVLLS